MYKNAYFHLLLKFIDKFQIPKLNQALFREVCDDNDFFKNKLFEEYELTNNPTDKVYWKDICHLFGSYAGKEDRKTISGDMKRLAIKYDKDSSKGGGKGCYLGLKLIEKTDEDKPSSNDRIP